MADAAGLAHPTRSDDDVEAVDAVDGLALLDGLCEAAFAVERTQELLVDLVGLMEASEIPNTPILIDSQPFGYALLGAMREFG